MTETCDRTMMLQVSRHHVHSLSNLLKPTGSNLILFKRWNQVDSKQNTSATSETSADEEDQAVKLERLSRPLGVESKPTSAPLTWQQKKEDLLNYDKHIQKRRHL